MCHNRVVHVLYVVLCLFMCSVILCFFFQAEDGIRDLVRSRGLGDVYKRQVLGRTPCCRIWSRRTRFSICWRTWRYRASALSTGRHLACLLYTSDAADERSSVDLGGRRIIKKQNTKKKTKTKKKKQKTTHEIPTRVDMQHRW